METLKYAQDLIKTNNELFKQVVDRISELGKVDLTNEEIAEHQALISFTQHYRIIF